VSVAGRAVFEGGATIDCSFECQSMRIEGKGFGPAGQMSVNGSLMVRGNADLDASVRVSGSVRAGDLDVAGHLRSGPLSAHRLRVGGHLEVRGTLEAEEVDAGGHMTAHGEVKIRNLRVGGHAKVGGGAISGEIRIRGHFDTTGKLTFGRLQVYGNTLLPGGSAGEKLTSLGKIVFDGDASCKELEVSGTAKARGVLSTENVSLKGALIASGNLKASKRFQVWGSADIAGALECETLDIGGKLVADRASATNRTAVAGEVRTTKGLKSEALVVGKGSKVTGPIIGGSIDIGSEADMGSLWGIPWWQGGLGRPTAVEDIHGGNIVIRAHSAAGHIFGRNVMMEEGAMAEEVVYTGEVKLPKKYFLQKPPRKVDTLPEPPF